MKRLYGSIRAVLRSLQVCAQSAKKGDIVSCVFSTHTLLFVWRDAWIPTLPTSHTPRFVITKKARELYPDWTPLFSTEGITLLERPHGEYGKLRELLPRNGKIYADTLRNALHNPPETDPLPEDEATEPCILAAGIWIDGALRHSYVAAGNSVNHALLRIAHGIHYDTSSDYKPLTSSDLPRADIELALVSGPFVSVSFSTHYLLDSSSVYRISREKQRAYVFPLVHNAAHNNRVSTWGDMKILLERKAGVSSESTSVTQYETAKVSSCIVCHDTGTVKIIENGMPLMGSGDREAAGESAVRAYTFLLKNQEPDGSFYTIHKPKTGERERFDLLRFALTLEALALYETNAGAISHAVRRGVAYVTEILSRYKEEVTEYTALARMHHARTLMLLGQKEEARNLFEAHRVPASKRSPLYSALFLTTYTLLYGPTAHSAIRTEEYTNHLISQLLSKSEDTDCVLFAEAALALKESDSRVSHDTIAWILSHMRKDGAILHWKNKNVVTTRGTGKIYEVLAVFGDTYREPREKIRTWLLSQQYRKENAYFIPIQHREKIDGGFRHTPLDTDIWIDSNAHFLIGYVREKEHASLHEKTEPPQREGKNGIIGHMIRRLTGVVLERNDNTIVLDVHGVGYLLSIPSRIGAIPEGEHLTLHTYLAVREDALDLYGFGDKEELEVFMHLIALQGIGPKSALNIVSTASPDLIRESVMRGDAAYLSKLSGIGKKSAEKIVAGLRERMDISTEIQSGSSHEHDVIDALLSLGYGEAEARGVLATLKDSGAEDTKTLLKEALKHLGKK